MQSYFDSETIFYLGKGGSYRPPSPKCTGEHPRHVSPYGHTGNKELTSLSSSWQHREHPDQTTFTRAQVPRTSVNLGVYVHEKFYTNTGEFRLGRLANICSFYQSHSHVSPQPRLCLLATQRPLTTVSRHSTFPSARCASLLGLTWWP